MSDHLQQIERLLTSKIGLDPLAIGPGSVARAVALRMVARGIEHIEAYQRCVVESETELGKLIDEVIVPESWFFRDERPFRWLESQIRGRWLGDPSRPPLRVASLACSGGEEAYSIAMVLLELGLPARRFWIDAVDVSARRLEIARRGIYGANSFRGLTNGKGARWMTYFTKRESGFELDPAVRAAVHFLQGSVLAPGLLAGSAPYDVIFCRNVLIYFDEAARIKVLSAIEERLSADGFLVIGHADRLEPFDEAPRFSPAADPGTFVYRRAVRAVPGAIEASRGVATVSDRAIVPVRAHRQAGLPQVQSAAAEPKVNLAPERPASLERAAGLANEGVLTAAIEECERHIRQKGPSAAGFYLMGMIRQAMGDREQAEGCFQKTVYLEPAHADALLALALLAERRGDASAAATYQRRALRAAERALGSKGDSA